MKNLKSDGNILDRISKLPDSLILEILSLLKMRDAVRTTLLSKRWKDLWVTIPCLKFQNFMRDLVDSRFFVYRILTLWKGGHLREFSIDFSTDSEASLSMDMALWVQFAAEKKVQDLCIHYYSNTGQLCPPQCLYECSSLRKLSLYGCNLQIRGNINIKWRRLSSLKLSDCVFSEDVMNLVLSSSPQLEDFTIRCVRRFQNLSIRSSSLKKLCIIRYLDDDPSVLTIWAPNLQVLTYSGTPCTKFLLTDISSLTEVQLTDSCFQVLRGIEGNDSSSPLSNVKLLTIGSWWIELPFIAGVLDIFPKLKMLIINWKYVGDQQFKFDAENYTVTEAYFLESNLLHLRTLVINCDASSYNASLFEFIGFLLKHATMIEKTVIRRKGVVNSEEMFEAAKKLLSLQSSFPSVELLLC